MAILLSEKIMTTYQHVLEKPWWAVGFVFCWHCSQTQHYPPIYAHDYITLLIFFSICPTPVTIQGEGWPKSSIYILSTVSSAR